VIERSLFFCSFQKRNEKSDRSFALSKRATKRAIALSLFQKGRKSENERLLNFKMSECPTLDKSLFSRICYSILVND